MHGHGSDRWRRCARARRDSSLNSDRCSHPGAKRQLHRVAQRSEEREMTKADLIEQVHEAIGPGVTKRDCAAVVNAFLNAVKGAVVQGNHIEIRGFGTFKVRERRTRMARNPRTGDPVRVPQRKVPVFKPSRLLRDEVAASLEDRS
ncbi:HU family DNA-binding protein [Candidatus Palauibacter sp.]|uniref:HU family DNA-binding protein n=2 Tax=Candidatus Palauibacter sp. TaxID=3101350 RepID=UPI003B5190DF